MGDRRMLSVGEELRPHHESFDLAPVDGIGDLSTG